MVPGLYNVELLETMEQKKKKKKRGRIEECVARNLWVT
jgi:hypothetical protein